VLGELAISAGILLGSAIPNRARRDTAFKMANKSKINIF
jgi:hypothetical protein